MKKDEKPRLLDGPDCYKCGYRRNVPGSAHSSCAHPEVKGTNRETLKDPIMGLTAIFASVRAKNTDPVIDTDSATKLGIKCNSEHAMQQGWFNWPWNFDPRWLQNCEGFKSKQEVCEECPSSLACITGTKNSVMTKTEDCWK